MRPQPLRARAGHAGLGALVTVTTLGVVAPTTARSQDPSPTTPAPAAQAAQGPTATKASASFAVRSVRRHVTTGRAVVVKGRLAPAKAGNAVGLQVRTGSGWTTVDKARTRKGGAYRLTWKASRPGARTLRVTFAGTKDARAAKRTVGRVYAYRRAMASWYGPGLYGGALGCGGTLTPGTIGVAHKTLPCGTKLRLRYRGRTVRASVIDRGPYVGGREFDLTAATKQRLGFGSTGMVLSTR
ncbi:septal ring lytic transglycosylase RlpA family protein [Conexibacter sp. SYSU D00693]|uniref:septal ring lytic transglycosylase RlpA family protein n=1 Tax=Conexibacter sp. SYSU D00693 TaxID=2812560 RepID=UPI00196AAC5F|nr:septal ring lytic transglycosylase RlpA family protein [Conexibacter sp. SYSU D00693]